MRVPKSWVTIVAVDIVDKLLTEGFIAASVTKDELVRDVKDVMMAELMAEDKVNEEVRELLRAYEPEIERGRMDYKKLFDLTKHKLIKERNIVI
ncbi:MAG: DUF507 family protein [Nitrospirae bacterium YQR-1]